jgi:hypothetical protein
MEYTTRDAMLDIIPWQFPCTLVITALLLLSSLDLRVLYATFASRPALTAFVSAFAMSWIVVGFTVLAMDLLILPPMFALVRFACAVWFTS